MDKQVEVLNLTIKIGGREIKLTQGEAKKLHEVLRDLFNIREVFYPAHWYWPPNVYTITAPGSVEPECPPYVVTCDAGNHTATVCID